MNTTYFYTLKNVSVFNKASLYWFVHITHFTPIHSLSLLWGNLATLHGVVCVVGSTRSVPHSWRLHDFLLQTAEHPGSLPDVLTDALKQLLIQWEVCFLQHSQTGLSSQDRLVCCGAKINFLTPHNQIMQEYSYGPTYYFWHQMEVSYPLHILAALPHRKIPSGNHCIRD